MCAKPLWHPSGFPVLAKTYKALIFCVLDYLEEWHVSGAINLPPICLYGSNIANKTKVITGTRNNKKIEIKSGLSEGDIIVAEGLKKVRSRGKIKPINK